MTGTLWTLGHSTLAWADFIEMLDRHGIRMLADVRRYPGSRRHPQFASDAMAAALASHGIDYAHLPALGGRRTPQPGSRNTAWRNAGFRGYADYMETPAYADARDMLAGLAAATPTAVMCAEALWWQCHRGLVADDFKARGWNVLHVAAGRGPEPHPYTSAARIVDGVLDYSDPAPRQQSLL